MPASSYTESASGIARVSHDGARSTSCCEAHDQAELQPASIDLYTKQVTGLFYQLAETLPMKVSPFRLEWQGGDGDGSPLLVAARHPSQADLIENALPGFVKQESQQVAVPTRAAFASYQAACEKHHLVC